MGNFKKLWQLFVYIQVALQSLAFGSQCETALIYPPIFVSLGKDCHIVETLRDHQLRTEAYPLDWLLTLNEGNLIAVLDNDFDFFIDKKFLTVNELYVRNTLYQIDFWHDWPVGLFEEFFDEIKEKYDRRIQRFKKLNSYQGKVFFIRGASSHPCQHKNLEEIGKLLYQSVHSDHPNIDHIDAKKLKEVLDRKFPDLNFTLVIINFVEYLNIDEKIHGLDNVVEYQIRRSHMNEDFAHIAKLLTRVED